MSWCPVYTRRRFSGIPSCQSDSWWRHSSTEGAWRCAWCTECSRSCSRVNEEDEVLVVNGKWDNNQGWDMGTPTDQILFRRTRCSSWAMLALEPSAWCAFRACEQTALHRCVLWVGVLSTHSLGLKTEASWQCLKANQLTGCVEVGFVSRVHLLFWRSTQCYYCPQGCVRSTGGNAWNWKRVKRRGSWMVWRAQSRRVTLTECMDDMRDAHNSNLSHDVVFKSWRPELDYWTMCTWDHACIIHVLRFMCAVWKVLWDLVVA